MTYKLIFDHYSDADNFREAKHFGNIFFKITSAKDSLFSLGVKVEDNFQQPFYQNDRSKGYWLTTGYTELIWNINAISSLGAKYEHMLRRFNKEVDRQSDYEEDLIEINTIYTKSQDVPLLLEYRYETHENDKLQPNTSELKTHSILAGLRFRPEKILSGTVAAGYSWSRFNTEDVFEGWVTDTELRYRIGAFTTMSLSAKIGVTVSDRTARDTLDYYDYKGLGLTLTYRRLDPLHLTFNTTYMNRDYHLATGSTAREDDLYHYGIRSDYDVTTWLRLSLGYSYRTNDSSISDVEYEENLFQVEAVLSI